MNRLITMFCASLILLATSAQSQAPPQKWARSHDVDFLHYKLKMSFDWKQRLIQGDASITVRPFKLGVKEVELDAGNMTITSVKVSADKTAERTATFRYENNEKLFVSIEGLPSEKDITINVVYSATPKQGLYFINADGSIPNQPKQIWSQGESETNHYWFPCYDYPNDKATLELTATVDEPFIVISNGELVSVKSDKAKKQLTYYWKMMKPFSSYLASIIVGEFAEIKDYYKKIPVYSYVYPNQLEDGKRSFEKIAKMIAFFSERFGYEYPYPKYAQTTVSNTPFGGMENISATTLVDNTVFDARAMLDANAEPLISHELSHQWFGDLVTCHDWSDIWLNESFATLMENEWMAHAEGKEESTYEMYQNQQAYFGSWDLGQRRPIVTKRYSTPDELFDVYAYPRGGAVLNMLRYILGEDQFWKAIKYYLKKHEYTPVETAQFRIAIEESTGQSLQWFFDEWLYKMGHPEFELTSSYNDSSKVFTLKVKQTQKPDSIQTWHPAPDFFIMPVDIALTTSSGESVHRVKIDSTENVFSFKVSSQPSIVNFDKGNFLIKRVKFNRSDEEVAYQLLFDRDMTGRLRAAVELKSNHSPVSLDALKKSSTSDSFWGVRLAATNGLASFKGDTSRTALIQILSDWKSQVRVAAINALGNYKDSTLADLFINRIQTDSSYAVVHAASIALGKSGSSKIKPVFATQLTKNSWRETIRASAVRGLVAAKDSTALDLILPYSKQGFPSELRGAAIQAIGEFGKGSDVALNTLTGYLSEDNPTLYWALIGAFDQLNDVRSVPALEAFLKRPYLFGEMTSAVTDLIQRLKSPPKENADKK